LLAYACSPFRGSEPAIGWNRALGVAEHCATWVVCKQQDYQADVARYFQDHPRPASLSFHYLPLTRAEMLLRRLPGCWYLAYNLWHRRAFRLAAQLHAAVGFDLVHQVTLSGFREPGYLWKLGLPFAWGPVGGVQNYPWRFLPGAGLRGALKEGARNVLNGAQFSLSPRVAAAARAARVLLSGNSTACRAFRSVHGVESALMPNVGAPAPVRRPQPRGGPQPPGGPVPLRLLWSGLLEPHKALHLLIEALAGLPQDVEWRLRVLGEGSQRRRWQALAARRRIAGRCEWPGWLPHEEALKQYEWADLLVFTSLRDTCPSVVMEALSRGLPVLCLDHQGVGDVVTADCGMKVPVSSPAQVVTGLRDGLELAARDPQLLGRLGEGALRRAECFQWSRQAQRIVELYRRAVGAEAAR
jgi:glycosyltransferase involved in cell wall biosynthesis